MEGGQGQESRVRAGRVRVRWKSLFFGTEPTESCAGVVRRGPPAASAPADPAGPDLVSPEDPSPPPGSADAGDASGPPGEDGLLPRAAVSVPDPSIQGGPEPAMPPTCVDGIGGGVQSSLVWAKCFDRQESRKSHE